MFTISQPVIETRDGKSRMTSSFSAPGLNKEIFFETEEQFGQYLTHEVADAFVVAAMLPALVAGEDIEVPRVSSDLAYHFDTLSFLLSKVFDCPPIRLHAGEVVDPDFKPYAVGTGFSGGVDSFCTYIRHTSDPCPESKRITHLALFNVGAYGNDYAHTSTAFHNDLKRARAFAEDVGKPLVPLDSNISAIYTHEKLFHYSSRLFFCISSGILALQKLFKVYLVSSSGTIDDMKLERSDQDFYAAGLIQRLSTAHTNILIAEHDLDRVQKTKMLVSNPLVSKHLYVCASETSNEKRGTSFKRDTAPNCTECFKCLRTIGTFDLLGVADDFSTRFDLKKWEARREQFYVDVYLKKNSDHFMKEIWDLFVESGRELSPSQQEMIRRVEEERKRESRARRPQLSARTCLRVLGGKVLRRLGLKKPL